MENEKDTSKTVIMCVDPRNGTPCVLELLESWICLPDEDDIFRPWSSTVIRHRVFAIEIDSVYYESIEPPEERSVLMSDSEGNRIKLVLPLRAQTMKAIGTKERISLLQNISRWNLYWRSQ